MDKIARYQTIILDILQEYEQIERSLTPEVKYYAVADKEKQHYVLLAMGFHQQRFVYHSVFHFDIIDGKVWIQQNNTDVLIADELEERGVLKSDIVLGFIPPHARTYTGFAAA